MSTATTGRNRACTCDPCTCADGRWPCRADLTGEFVSGFLDGLAERGFARKRFAGDADGACFDVDIDVGNAGEPADLGPDGAGAVVAGHPRDREGAS